MTRRTGRTYATIVLAVLLSVAILDYGQQHGRLQAIAQEGPAIDLFTDNAPCDGKGFNQSAGLYGPQDAAVLHAFVTYNDQPRGSMLVAFQVIGPTNPFQNITFSGSGETDETGVTQFLFRIPWPFEKPEQVTFGEWFAIATVRIADQEVADTLSFRVGWVVQVIEIATLDPELRPQSLYSRQDPIIFNLTVQNNACTEKLATITIDVQDSILDPIIHIQIENVLFQQGKSNLQTASQIPLSSKTGVANVSAAPLTAPPEQNGTLYSPAIYTTFQIPGEDIAIADVTLSANTVIVGESVTINVVAINRGNVSETFDLSVYYNSTLIETQDSVSLPAFAQQTFVFYWTTNVPSGFYQISASAPLAADENPSDNSYIDGIVEVAHARHDIAVINVVPSSSIVNSGEMVNIVVTVKNEGKIAESFNVTVYYDHIPIDRKLVSSLAPGAQTEVPFSWNTSGVFPLKYVISAVADRVEGETEVENNLFIDGAVTISPYPPFFPTSDWMIFWAIVMFAGIGGSILLFLILCFDRLRRRRKHRRQSYTVIAHPHI